MGSFAAANSPPQLFLNFHLMIRLKRSLDILIWFSAAGLIILPSMFIYSIGGEAYLHWKYAKTMRGYFAVEVVNETNKKYTIHLLNHNDGKVIGPTSVDAVGRATIISRASEEVYKVELIDGEQKTSAQEIYVYSLPHDRRQIRMIKDGEIQIKIKKKTMQEFYSGYQKYVRIELSYLNLSLSPSGALTARNFDTRYSGIKESYL